MIFVDNIADSPRNPNPISEKNVTLPEIINHAITQSQDHLEFPCYKAFVAPHIFLDSKRSSSHGDLPFLREETMKLSLFFLLALIPLMAFAQGLQHTIPGDPGMDDGAGYSDGFGMSGVVGAISMDGETYSQVRLRPELGFGKFGFGLDIDFLFDANGDLIKENWEDWQDYVDKIFFIRYGTREDPFYAKAGCFSSYVLGHGLIFDHYSNVLRYPAEKQVGAYVGVNTFFSGIGVEAFTHNIHKNEIIAGRLHGNPLHYTQLPYLENLKIGINVGVDRNQHGKYPDRDKDAVPDVYDAFPNDSNYWLDTDGDGIPDQIDFDINGNGIIDHPSMNPWVAENLPDIHEIYPNTEFDLDVYPDSVTKYKHWREIRVFSVDYSIPLVSNPIFHLDHYGEYAKIDKYGSGIIFPGFSSKFSIFHAKFEFRNFSDQFLPGYFDRLYDEQRSEVRIEQVGGRNVYSLETKEQFLITSRASMGWFAYLSADIMQFGNVKMAYQDMYGSRMNTGKSLWASVSANPPDVLRLKEAGITYSQTHARYIDFLNPRNSNAALSGRLIYALSSNADLIGRYSEIYTDTNRDGKIQAPDEVISSMSFGVEFRF